MRQNQIILKHLRIFDYQTWTLPFRSLKHSIVITAQVLYWMLAHVSDSRWSHRPHSETWKRSLCKEFNQNLRNHSIVGFTYLMEDYVQIPFLVLSGENPEMKVEFQMVRNKQQVVWVLLKIWVPWKMDVDLFFESFPSQISMYTVQHKVGHIYMLFVYMCTHICSYIYTLHFILCVFVCICVHMCIVSYMWGSEDNLCELVLSFDFVGLRAWTWVIRLGGRHLYQLSELTGPKVGFE